MWKKSSWLKFHVTVHEFVHIEHVYEYTLVIVNIEFEACYWDNENLSRFPAILSMLRFKKEASKGHLDYILDWVTWGSLQCWIYFYHRQKYFPEVCSGKQLHLISSLNPWVRSFAHCFSGFGSCHFPLWCIQIFLCVCVCVLLTAMASSNQISDFSFYRWSDFRLLILMSGNFYVKY